LYQISVGYLALTTILDSGSGRSLITAEHFRKLQEADPRLRFSSTDVKCFSASGQSLDILGEVRLRVKIYVYTWNWFFLISKNLCGPPILGADFIAATNMILHLAENRCYFAFAPAVGINFEKRRYLCVVLAYSQFRSMFIGNTNRTTNPGTTVEIGAGN
jgi:hypothetical protein